MKATRNVTETAVKMHVRRALLVALAIALTVCAGGLLAGTAMAEGCANEQLRTEQPYGLTLPDCRAYELVSPLEKRGNNVARDASRGAASGEAIAYFSKGSFLEGEGALLNNAYISRRTADGWTTQNITPPYAAFQSTANAPYGEMIFSPELSKGLLLQEFSYLPPKGLANLYVSDFSEHSYRTVTEVAPPESEPYEETSLPAPGGTSTDLSHIVYQQFGNLTPEAAASPPSFRVYEWVEGHLRSVDVGTTGTVLTGRDSVGAPGDPASHYQARDVWHAVSEDGSRVYFTGGEGGEFTGQLYLRENAPQPQSPLGPGGECQVPQDACTVEVSASRRGAPDSHGTQPARYWDASANGSRVFFTSRSELTDDANTGSEDNAANLYEYDLENGVLSDLSVDGNAADVNGAAVLGVVTASEDGSYVYFVAEGALAGAAESGKPNLYLSHAGNTTFIATLAAADEFDWQGGEEGTYAQGPATHTARVSPDGNRLAFLSTRRLTGYDNEAAESGECGSGPCNEAFLFAAGSGKLVCASCDPSGARPVGPATFDGYEDPQESFDPVSASGYYLPRNAFADGRLFFESPDALLARDSNGRRDVYEYEDGQLYLVSNGVGIGNSYFLDASASGGDVFIATVNGLLPQDADERVDVYDARVDGGYPVSALPPACDNGDSCKGPVSPQPAAFGAPASATFSGLGTPASRPPAATKTKSKKKHVKKAKKKSKRTTKHGRQKRSPRRSGGQSSTKGVKRS